MARVQLQNLTKTYSTTIDALRGVSLDIEHGELLVLVGPSGCGKSTTLRLIAGLEQVSSGSIHIGDEDVTRRAPADRDVAMVFQNYSLWPHMSVRENLCFGRKTRLQLGWPHRLLSRFFQPKRFEQLQQAAIELDDDLLRTARKLGIEGMLNRKPTELSGGEQQRVAVGRALLRHPKVFLFDEPLSNLDARLRVDMRREFKRLHAELASTMIYVTHDQVEALSLGTRIAVMDQGQVRQIGPPSEIYEQPVDQFVAGFIGSFSMNFLPGTMECEAENLFWRGNTCRVPIPDRRFEPVHGRVVLGIRPEYCYLDEVSARRLGDTSECSGQVYLLEPLGSEYLVHLQTNEGNVVCKTESTIRPGTGENVRVFFPIEKIHLFDAQTQRSLRARL